MWELGEGNVGVDLEGREEGVGNEEGKLTIRKGMQRMRRTKQRIR